MTTNAISDEIDVLKSIFGDEIAEERSVIMIDSWITLNSQCNFSFSIDGFTVLTFKIKPDALDDEKTGFRRCCALELEIRLSQNVFLKYI